MEAARMGRLDAVKTLLSHLAHVNAEGNNGETALAFALQEKHDDVAATLRDAGAK
jgi:ankyrin repeat protein